MQGTVDRVVADEGFGFIIGPNGEEYFFHRTALKGVDWEELGPGVPVIFQSTVGEGDRLTSTSAQSTSSLRRTPSPRSTMSRCRPEKWPAASETSDDSGSRGVFESAAINPAFNAVPEIAVSLVIEGDHLTVRQHSPPEFQLFGLIGKIRQAADEWLRNDHLLIDDGHHIVGKKHVVVPDMS